MKSFEVLTVTKREGWFERACEQIEGQTLKPSKWVIVPEGNLGEFHATYPCPIEFWPAPMQIRTSNLNASLNEGLRHIDTPYVIFYQDFIDLPKDCFKKLMGLVNNNTFVTTVTKNDEQTPEEDPRYTRQDKARHCKPEDWESNVAAAPMDIIRALGGFEEEYDNGWSWDNRNLAERAAMLSCQFILDETNRPQLLYHPKIRDLPLNAEFHDQVMNEIRTGIRPLKCDYL